MTGRDVATTPADKEVRQLARGAFERGEPLAAVTRLVREAGVPAGEAPALAKALRRRWRQSIVNAMISALLKGAEPAEVEQQFAECGETKRWIAKAVQRAGEEVVEVEVTVKDGRASRRTNLIGLGLFGIVGGVIATFVSASRDGMTFFWGAIVAGVVSLISGLAMRKRSDEVPPDV